MLQKVSTFILVIGSVMSLFSQNKLDSLFVELQKEMKNQKSYDDLKVLRIEELRKVLSSSEMNFESSYIIRDKLIKEYEYYKLDSALYYIEENLDLAKKYRNRSLENKANLKLAKVLTTSGMYLESINILDQIDNSDFSSKMMIDYFFVYRKCYGELYYFSKLKKNKKRYGDFISRYKDSLDSYVAKEDANSLLYLTEEEQKYVLIGDLNKALEINDKRLKLVEMGTREYSMVAYERSNILLALSGGKSSNEYKKYIIQSSISDIKASVKDNAAMAILAINLFEEGDINEANRYINFSFDDAKFYNSKLRTIQLSNVFPVISKSYEEISSMQKSKLKRMLICISFLVLVLLIALVYIFNQFKKLKSARNELKIVNNELQKLNLQLSSTNADLKRLNEELFASDRMKEHYIGTFLNLYSEYIDKLDIYRNTVRKYLTTNKVKTLLELTKSKELVANELKLFYANFDKSFLHIYPNFIDELNALLKEDNQIVLKKGELLNTELRIFALIRLGITNSSKISKILRYSVNTIYNYRVRVRNNAKDRDAFEDLVRNIT